MKNTLFLCCLILAGCGGGGGGGETGNTTGGLTPPSIAMFSPASGGIGDQVHIEGLNFSSTPSGNTVRFNGVTANVLSATASAIAAVVPSGATTGKIQVTTSGGAATSSTDFTVLSATGPGNSFTTRLRGPGPEGWPTDIAWNGTRFALVNGDDILTSTDSRVWTVAKAFAFHDDIAWDGTQFVAVGAAAIYRSLNGLTWTELTDTWSFDDLYAVTGSGSQWVAVGEGGWIRTSADGTTWVDRDSTTTQNLRGVTWTGSQFVAVGAAGTVVTSPDGVTWTLRPPPTTSDFTAIGSSTSLIVATTFYSGPTSPDAILTSPDGITWTSRANLGPVNKVIHAGGRFVAVGYGLSATSSDGISWTQSSIIPGTLESLAYTGGEYVAVGINRNVVGNVFSSNDGLNWSVRTTASKLTAIARSPSDGRIVAVGGSDTSQTSLDTQTWEFGLSGTNSDQNYPFLDVVWSPSANSFISMVQVAANIYAYKSTDGTTWSNIYSGLCNGTLAASETLIVNIGAFTACIGTSPDGVTWTPRTAPAGQQLRKAFWTGSQFVAVGSSGAIATSPDGTSWTARPSGITKLLNGGAAGTSAIVVVGDEGTLLSSGDNGMSWTIRTSGTTFSLKRAVWTGVEFYVAGNGGTLLRSADGVSWTKLSTPYTSALNDLIWLSSPGQLVLVGDNGLTATSP